jgi:hypothetical protein
MNDRDMIERNIKNIILSEEYIQLLQKLGFSQVFILKEQVRKQKACIDFLVNKIAESGIKRDFLLLDKMAS